MSPSRLIPSLKRAAHQACLSLLGLIWLVTPLSAQELPPADNATQQADSESGGETIADVEPPFAERINGFVSKYCIDCHGPDEPSADRSFVKLPESIVDDNALVDYQDILDQLNLGEMPPSDNPQPPTAERRLIIEAITTAIRDYHQNRESRRSEVVLRRLNSREYRNVVRDLLQVNLTMFDPTERFPLDQEIEHLDNIGEALVTSGHLLARYLDAADQVVHRAMQPVEQPTVQSWKFEDGFNQQPEIDQVHRKTNRFEYLTLYDVVGADKHEGAYAPIHAFDQGVPHSGIYEISFRAAGVNRDHPYDDSFLGTDRREPLKLGIVAGNQAAGPLHKPQPVEPLLAEVDLSDDMRTYRLRIWLDQGFTLRFTFRNGLMDVRNLWSRIQRKYPELFPKVDKGIVAQRYNAIANGKLPQIHVDDIEISGPYYDQWPTRSQQALLGNDWASAVAGELPAETVRKHLKHFMDRAYRRPAAEEELRRIEDLIALRRNSGRSPLEAYGDGIKAILCSPSFLFWDEGKADKLSDWSLACRLSSFLWSSMPDEQLFELAQSEQLSQPDVLIQQLRRMLKSPKSQAFIVGFLDSWLTLRELGGSPPDRDQFAAYYHYDLGTAMREETRLFTRYLLDNNRSIEEFLDSDYTFVNKRLADHYELEMPPEIVTDASRFVKVRLPDGRRGGLLGQASVLTVSANGIDTSPVVRGVWLLENILGTPPNPPPADVEPLDPDVRGAKAIRDQLKKHRSVPSCYDCHRKIDPIGFALENFDPIGGWRESYRRDVPIDSSGELPNGSSFAGIQDLKPLLIEQRKQFARSLTSKLLSYALGRQLTINDRPDIDRIVEELSDSDFGFRDLVELVVLSPQFRSK